MKPTILLPASPPTSLEVGKDKSYDKAIENGDIQNIYRGFQPLEILFELFPRFASWATNISPFSTAKSNVAYCNTFAKNMKYVSMFKMLNVENNSFCQSC